MPKNLRKDIANAKALMENTDAVLVVTGAGMSVDSGIPTYRGTNGLWAKSIDIGDKSYGYDEISSLEMWKTNPELAWGFKAHFRKLSGEQEPHEGYYDLLENVSKKSVPKKIVPLKKTENLTKILQNCIKEHLKRIQKSSKNHTQHPSA